MINFFRLFFKLIPSFVVMPVLTGRLRGKRWIQGSGVNAYRLGNYEIEKQKLFESLVRTGDVVYDIGANVGFYTLLASELVGKQGKVFAFEPLPRNINYLKKHIELNKCKNVFVIEAAVYNIEGEVNFGEDAYGSVYGRVVDDVSNIKVKSVVLDKMVKEQIVSAPNVLKLDIEGNELMALKGAENILKQYHPIIFLTTHSEKIRQDCLSFLKGLKYNFGEINEKDTSEICAY
jgi:FkbM family methyltransferase